MKPIILGLYGLSKNHIDTSGYEIVKNNDAINNNYPIPPLDVSNINYFINLITAESHMITLINVFAICLLYTSPSPRD